MKKMKLFESAVCTCSQNPNSKENLELLRIHVIVEILKKQGIEIERYNINEDSEEFIENEVIFKYIQSVGVNGLPAIVVDDEIVIMGRYPSRSEFISLLGVSKEVLISKNIEDGCSCGCSDGCCNNHY